MRGPRKVWPVFATRAGRAARAAVAAAALAAAAPAGAADEATVTRGAYLVAAGGCVDCHTDAKAKGPPFAGGAAIKTPFGDFYAPNITPHPERGIGNWSEADFKRALRDGVEPDGAYFFPVFPYTSFTNITDDDLKAMYAYLMSLAPVDRASRPHDIAFPFGWRFLQTFWRLLYFEPGPYRPDPAKPAAWNRGAYLVKALVHCGECHTPRDGLGGLDRDMWLAGAVDGPEGTSTPNITPDNETGIGKWSDADITSYLKIGMDPEGDFAGSLMADVIAHGTSKLTDADIAAIVAYLRALPPIKHKVARKKKD